jgi:hypothetical protein
MLKKFPELRKILANCSLLQNSDGFIFSLSFIRLTENYSINPFDCVDSDLNDSSHNLNSYYINSY